MWKINISSVAQLGKKPQTEEKVAAVPRSLLCVFNATDFIDLETGGHNLKQGGHGVKKLKKKKKHNKTTNNKKGEK